MSRNPAITLKVAPAALGAVVGAAIDFYDHSTLKTCEVDDEGANRKLAAESIARDLAFAE